MKRLGRSVIIPACAASRGNSHSSWHLSFFLFHHSSFITFFFLFFFGESTNVQNNCFHRISRRSHPSFHRDARNRRLVGRHKIVVSIASRAEATPIFPPGCTQQAPRWQAQNNCFHRTPPRPFPHGTPCPPFPPPPPPPPTREGRRVQSTSQLFSFRSPSPPCTLSNPGCAPYCPDVTERMKCYQ